MKMNGYIINIIITIHLNNFYETMRQTEIMKIKKFIQIQVMDKLYKKTMTIYKTYQIFYKLKRSLFFPHKISS